MQHATEAATKDGLSRAATGLDAALAQAGPRAVIAAATRAVAPGRLAVVSSFGIESAALLYYVADVDAALPVLFLDTGWMFEETFAYRDALVARLGLRDVRTIVPNQPQVSRRDPDSDLWMRDPDACCRLRKAEPLDSELAAFDAWINGRKRFHGGARNALPVVEADRRWLKFNPLAAASPADIAAVFGKADLPPHPLAVHGFTSIGCMPCSTRTRAGEGPRAGRWRGSSKTECGIHASAKASAEP